MSNGHDPSMRETILNLQLTSTAANSTIKIKNISRLSSTNCMSSVDITEEENTEAGVPLIVVTSSIQKTKNGNTNNKYDNGW